VLLGGLRMKAQWAALLSLAMAIAVALIVYGMPFGQTLLSASEARRSACSRSCGSSYRRSGSTT
jgi:L-lactate permease